MFGTPRRAALRSPRTASSPLGSASLFEDTTFTRPVDFHSWRRAYSQALANVGASAQQASTLAGHSSLDAHQRYLNNTAKMAEVPAAALPSVRVLPQLVGKTPSPKGKNTKVKSPVLPGLFEQLRGGATRAVYRDNIGV